MDRLKRFEYCGDDLFPYIEKVLDLLHPKKNGFVALVVLSLAARFSGLTMVLTREQKERPFKGTPFRTLEPSWISGMRLPSSRLICYATIWVWISIRWQNPLAGPSNAMRRVCS